MPNFEIGQKVRFWSLEECVEWAESYGQSVNIEHLKRLRLPYWDEIVTIVAFVPNYVSIENRLGETRQVGHASLMTDLRSGSQLAIEILGEEYFGG